MLLAENRVYHFDYTALDLFYGGHRLSKKTFMRDMPSRYKFIAYPRSSGTRFVIQQYFPEYTEYKATKSLPGFTIFGPNRDTQLSQELSERS